MKKSSKEEFIAKAKKLHGDKYDYSLVEYKGSVKKVKIICQHHGEFLQTPNTHLGGHGCPKCAQHNKKALVEGIGYNDCQMVITKYEHGAIAYTTWRNMFRRCYNKNWHKKFPAYSGCSVCKNWWSLSTFIDWFKKNYKEGYQLDKDILVHDNKVYSPNTCCFVPPDINKLIIQFKSFHKTSPQGVRQTLSGRFETRMKVHDHDIHLGTYDTESEALNAYRKAKKNMIIEMANDYYAEGKISEQVYDALLSYDVYE